MATKMAVIEEIRKSFSRYLRDDLYVPRHVWLELDPYSDTDEDKIHNNNLTTFNQLKTSEETIDRQKKDEIVDFDEGENKKLLEKSLKEEIDKTPAQELVTLTDKTSKSKIEGAENFVNSRMKRIKKNRRSQGHIPNYKKKKSFIKSTLELPNTLMEQKTLSINEWLQASSEIQLNNTMDEDVFDSFLLARYTEQIADESRVSSFIPQFSQPLELSVKQRTIGFCNENYLLDTTPPPFNDKIASKSVQDFSQPLDLSVKKTTPMSTDTGFCDKSFLLDSNFPCHSDINIVQTIQSNIAGDNRNVVDINDWMDNNRNYTGSVNDDENCNLIGIDRKMNENMEMLMVSATSTNIKPVPSTLQNNQRGSLNPDLSPTTKQQHDGSIMKVTLTETERPMIQECIFQSQQLPMWNMDNDSTDLDYEPYDDEDN